MSASSGPEGAEARPDPGSFRDPASGVFTSGGRVFRYFHDAAARTFTEFAETLALDRLIQQGRVIGTRVLSDDERVALDGLATPASLITEHPKLPFVSYIYEWPFDMLKAAALLHLRLMAELLDADFVLKDATPYNIQFTGHRPMFIDLGSIERYRAGSPWAGYAQFCRLFLNPLLLQSQTGVAYHGWLRSALEGIDPDDLRRVLPWRAKLRKVALVHVVLHAWLNRRLTAKTSLAAPGKAVRVEKAMTLRLLRGLSRAIETLVARPVRSHWVGYESQNTYDQGARTLKEGFVERYVAAAKPGMVWDLGCNTGSYAVLAAKHATFVVAMDNDPESVNALYRRLGDGPDNVLPLVVDCVNPSPDQGWAQQERRGLAARGPADVVLCLALLHHIRIGGNVPIRRFLEWLTQMARSAIIEFVPKMDPMVSQMLRVRPDVYDDYSQDAFEEAVKRQFRVDAMLSLPNGRSLYAVSRP